MGLATSVAWICTQGIQQLSSQGQFLPINPPRVVTPPASAREPGLPAQTMEQSFAHLAKHADQKLYNPTPQQAYYRDASPFRLPQRLTGSSLFIRLDLSRSYKNLPGCNKGGNSKLHEAKLPPWCRLHIKLLKIQTRLLFGKQKHPIPASSTLQTSCYRCRLCFRSLNVFFCRCMELLQAVCKLVTSSSFCL